MYKFGRYYITLYKVNLAVITMLSNMLRAA